MAYMSQTTIETMLGALDQPEAIGHRHAAEAAHILLARSRRHARRFALAMHGRVARGLDAGMIEHWARVVMQVARLTAAQQGTA
jgi:hypothetical protein